MTDPFAQLDGAYSLGALDADDLAAYEVHLRTCADCRARVEVLRPTMQVLARGRAAGVEAGEAGPVPDTLLPGLLRRVERERTRRRWTNRAVAGFAAACLTALVVVAWPSSSSSSSTSRPAPQALVAVRTSPVDVTATATATARLVAEPWGTEVTVHCQHEGYAAAHRVRYGLQIVDRDQHTYSLGTWAALSDSVTFTGGTAVRRERIARVQITLPDGTPILQLVL